ncbi:phosphatase PAP2 family protein [Mesonia sp. K7]|uniref:phosphatase PAP2 family protein n=1 Tax=Mesonia sp. K7 TaxID=2218606 RepID=UPI000DA8BCFD|nr:phosphatase PAP2 family protein [Mesonia sp. K7]PZD79675.1 phosphatase PAP2 family protein [Mesonia sp. K7]
MLEQLQEWDRQLFLYLNGLGVERFDHFWITVTQEETWIPLYFVFIGLLFFSYRGKKKFHAVLALFATFLITFGITRLIKAFIARVRPNNVDEFKDVIRILQQPEYYSFVSGHTSSSMAVTTFMVLLLRKKYKWVYVFYLWPLLFACSRVYVGVHYPGDLLGGAIVGVLIAIFCYKLFKKIAREDLHEVV